MIYFMTSMGIKPTKTYSLNKHLIFSQMTVGLSLVVVTEILDITLILRILVNLISVDLL